MSNKFWSYYKHKRSYTCGIGIRREGCQLVTEAAEKAEVLNRQFQSVFSTPAEETMPFTDESDMPPITVAAEGVRAQLQKLNPYKAMGPDNISPRVLKELSDVLSQPLAALFQKSLDHAIVPEDWKKVRVTPLYKKGDNTSPLTTGL